MMKNSDENPVNSNGVGTKQWNKWTKVGKHVFNKTFESMMKSPEVYQHPATVQTGLSNAEFKTIAWNAAFIAACVCSRGEKHLLKEFQEEVRGE